MVFQSQCIVLTFFFFIYPLFFHLGPERARERERQKATVILIRIFHLKLGQRERPGSRIYIRKSKGGESRARVQTRERESKYFSGCTAAACAQKVGLFPCKESPVGGRVTIKIRCALLFIYFFFLLKLLFFNSLSAFRARGFSKREILSLETISIYLH